MASLDPRHGDSVASSAATSPTKKPRDAIDAGHVSSRLEVDIGDISPAEDEDVDLSDTCSNYSSVSEDSLPPIHAYNHRYHGSGLVMTPNDDSEAYRMSLQHQLFQLCLDGGLVDAKLPLDDHTPENPLQVLDVGAGSGIWACEMGQRYPQVNVLGVDLTSALLPSDVPSNVTFEITDATDPWSPRTYDFIHMRNLVGGGIRDWRALVLTAYEHLKPGGQLEFTELRPRFFDVEPENADLPAGARPDIGGSCREFQDTYIEMSMRLGMNFDPVPLVSGYLTEVGAESIRERVDWLPVKSWGNDPISRKKGEILSKMLEYGLENWTLMLFGIGGWKEQDTRELLDRVKLEIQDPWLRSTVQATFVTARKPTEGPKTTPEPTIETTL